MKATLFPIVFCACALALCAFAQQDRRLESRATGKAVVEAVVASIHDSGIFPDDNRLLRRIAYVASRDGMSSDTFRRTLVRYGIWQTPKEAFRNINSNPIVQQKLIAIKQFFDIDWDRVTEGDLRKPLISGLAARLLLAIISDSYPIPEQGAIEAQARYWHQHYSKGRTGEVSMFIRRVKNWEVIEQGQCSLVGVDLMFLLDSSGSCSSDRKQEYSSMLIFVEKMVSIFDIGPTQTRVGVTVYSNDVETSFLLNSHQDNSSLINAIRQVPYTGGGTNTAAGLREVLNVGFRENNGVRPSKEAIPRVLFVLTDGASNDFDETVDAANAIHEQRPMIKVYAVGIGGGANRVELEAIATPTTETPSPYVFHQQSFAAEAFEDLRDQLTQEVCRSSAPGDVGEDIERDLEPGQQSRMFFQCPEDGRKARVCASTGQIQAYGSYCNSSPSEAYYDFMFVIEQGNCDNIYRECGSCDEGMERKRRQSVRDGQVVYITIEGVEETSTFVLETTPGVTSTPKGPRMKIHLINNSPSVHNSSVYVDFNVSRLATSLLCYLRQLQPITMESGAGRYGDAPGIQEREFSSNLVVYGNLEPGEYAFTVVANTSDGDSAVLTRKFWIGSGSYDCTAHLINDGVSMVGTTASVQFIGVGIFNSYQCSVDGKVLAGVCRSPLRVRGLLPGQHQVEVVPQGCQGEAYGFSKTFTVEAE